MKEFQTVIFLVRHGGTNFPYSRDPEVDDLRRLTDKGEEESKKNGEYLRSFFPAVIYSSPLNRTMETAEIIKKYAEIPGKVSKEKELLEIYNNHQWYSIVARLPKLLRHLVNKYSGKQVVCVSHQDVIEGSLRALKVTDKEADIPCQVGQMYRLVFAGKKFVQVTKLEPSK